MNMKTFLSKLKSRKFIAMLLGMTLGVALIFGVDGEEISVVAGAVTSMVSAVSYMLTEGKIDREALKQNEENL